MEQELKYLIPDEQTAQRILDSSLVRSAAAAGQQRIEMHAAYYDTAQGDLAAHGVSYRIRRENGRCVATVKTGGAQHGAMHERGEWELPARPDEPDLKAFAERFGKEGGEQLSAALAAAGEKPLVPVCGTDFVRTLLVIERDGACFEFCVDIGQLIKGEKRGPICELELEYKKGDIAVMEGFGAALRDAFGLSDGAKSKFARARAL